MDLSTKDGAESVARTIREYWKSKGYLVTTSLETIHYNANDAKVVWMIRSDMVNGLPTRRAVH